MAGFEVVPVGLVGVGPQDVAHLLGAGARPIEDRLVGLSGRRRRRRRFNRRRLRRVRRQPSGDDSVRLRRIRLRRVGLDAIGFALRHRRGGIRRRLARKGQNLARIDPVRILDDGRVEPVDLGPEQRVGEVKLGDRPERLPAGDRVCGRELSRLCGCGVRGVLRAGGVDVGRVLRAQDPQQQRHRSEGEDRPPLRTADRRPPHPAPPGTGRAAPLCPRRSPSPRPWHARTLPRLRRCSPWATA